MANLAQEEADRYFSGKEHHTSHPEDRDDLSQKSIEENEKHPKPGRRQLSSSGDEDGDDDDDDTANKMATMTQTKTSYHIPSHTSYANTGPKGVIADAQSFARAKQSSGFRTRLTSLANNLKSSITEKKSSPNNSDHSDAGLSEEDSDSEFMNTWRANRLQELSQQSSSSQYTRRMSPSRRIWGTLQEVDATGYLDAIEKVPQEQIVIVMIFDPSSTQSLAVADELGMLAYKHNTTRFVKLHRDIAEMKKIEVPAVLAYRGGDVFATISGAKAEGLEGVLRKQRILE